MGNHSTIAVGLVSIPFCVLFTLISENLLAALIGSVGLMTAFYCELTGFACAWFYRKTLTRSLRDSVIRGLVPLLGGVALLIVFIYGLIRYAKPGWLTDNDGNNITSSGSAPRGGRHLRAGARIDSDGGVVGDGPGLFPRPHHAARRHRSGYRQCRDCFGRRTAPVMRRPDTYP